ncbi:MAG: hypothetical protein PHS65_09105 [Arcobacteraceae bacterium]|nr:hypothetical protein [Arcobacteraceae bacterium]MDD3592213.1 hypothetical protein [Sulfurovum sp.]
MSKYIINSKNLSNGFEEEITKEQFEELAQSKEIFSEIFAKEKIYNIILMNYYEFEKELFEIILNNEVFNSDYPKFSEYFLKIEQRILNLLSSITLYLDSFKDDLKETKKYSTHLKDEFDGIVKFFNNELKNNKNLKIMKFVRNHIQHNGLLITNFSLNGVNLSDELREQTLKFEIDKNTIKAGWYKPENFTELDEKIDLKKNIRVYMDFMSRVHQKFREFTNQKTQSARNEYEKIFKKYPEHKYLYVAQKVDDEIIVEIPILLDWDNIRLEMVKQNKVPKGFKRHTINTK